MEGSAVGGCGILKRLWAQVSLLVPGGLNAEFLSSAEACRQAHSTSIAFDVCPFITGPPRSVIEAHACLCEQREPKCYLASLILHACSKVIWACTRIDPVQNLDAEFNGDSNYGNLEASGG